MLVPGVASGKEEKQGGFQQEKSSGALLPV